MQELKMQEIDSPGAEKQWRNKKSFKKNSHIASDSLSIPAEVCHIC